MRRSDQEFSVVGGGPGINRGATKRVHVSEKVRSNHGTWRRQLAPTPADPPSALALIWVYFGLSSEYFFTRTNIFNILLQAANIGIIAAGLTVVMITAEIDLSIGSLEALSGSVAAVVIIRYGMPIAVGICCRDSDNRPRRSRQRLSDVESQDRLVHLDAGDARHRAGNRVPAHERRCGCRVSATL